VKFTLCNFSHPAVSSFVFSANIYRIYKDLCSFSYKFCVRATNKYYLHRSENVIFHSNRKLRDYPGPSYGQILKQNSKIKHPLVSGYSEF
jgi:hypothetical protein